MAITINKAPKQNPLKVFTKDIADGKFDTTKLRALYPLLKTVALKSGEDRTRSAGISNYLDVEVIFCDVCAKLTFAHKTISAYHGAYWICQDCAPNFAVCQKCSTYVLTSDMYNPTHRHADFEKPGILYFPDREYSVAVYNADIMNGSRATGRDGYFRSPDEIKAGYQALDTNQRLKDIRYFGVELEVERIPGAPPDILERVSKSLNPKFVMLKHDGSLSRRGKNGFEIVSMPGTLKYHMGGVWNDFYQNLGEFFEENPPTTGLHIHMSLSTILPVTIGKMLMFVNSAKNREFICDVARRELGVPNPNGRIYAGVHDDWKASDLIKLRQHEAACPWHPRNKIANNRYKVVEGQIQYDAWGNPIIHDLIGSPTNVRQRCKCTKGMYNLQKYEALNVMTKRPTVELRIFRGIVKRSFFYAALEFSDALANYCADAGMNQLDYESFLAWIYNGRRKIYSNLFRHLINLGWIDPPKQKQELEEGAIPYRPS